MLKPKIVLTLVLALIVTNTFCACGTGAGIGGDIEKGMSVSFPSGDLVSSSAVSSGESTGGSPDGASETPTGDSISLTAETPNEMKAGEFATIILDGGSLPSDFTWICIISGGGVVEFVADTAAEYSINDMLEGERWIVGDGSAQVLTFKAVKPGEAVIEFTEKRGDDESGQTVLYHITVPFETPPGMGVLLATDTQNELNAGELASIVVDETPSTGFLWYYEILSGGVVEFVSEESRKNDPGNTMPGGDARTRYITFRAIKPGETVIEMVERRGDEVVRTATYRITVTE